jgi:hypothetical protein
MTFKLTIDTDNAAFSDDDDDMHADDQKARETARILREVAARLERGDDFSMYQTLHDLNGNDVGRAAFKNADGTPDRAPFSKGGRK